jgi:hypothetical protein
VLDPKVSGPTQEPNRYYKPVSQRGHDRPEIYVDPYNPGRAYLTVMGAGWIEGTAEEDGYVAVYRTDNHGTTWTWIDDWHTNLLDVPAQMTTTPSGNLYIAGPAWDGTVRLRKYNPQTGAFSGYHDVGNYRAFAGPKPLSIAATNVGISRVGSYQDGVSTAPRDVVRVSYTYLRANGDLGLAVQMVAVDGSTAIVVSTEKVYPPTGTSVVLPTWVESDRLDSSVDGHINPAMIYWYEVANGWIAGNGHGPGVARYTFFYDLEKAPVGCLSQASDGSCRTWPVVFEGNNGRDFTYGHYQKGAFWASNAGRNLNFLALWTEQPTAGSKVHKTNILTIALP